MDPPIGILDKEVLDVTDLAVAGMDMVRGDRFDAAEMRIAVVSLRGDILLPRRLDSGEARYRQGTAHIAVAAHVNAACPNRAPAIVIVDEVPICREPAGHC